MIAVNIIIEKQQNTFKITQTITKLTALHNDLLNITIKSLHGPIMTQNLPLLNTLYLAQDL